MKVVGNFMQLTKNSYEKVAVTRKVSVKMRPLTSKLSAENVFCHGTVAVAEEFSDNPRTIQGAPWTIQGRFRRSVVSPGKI